jgi:alkylhydroperoxidase/carboxymuconolactone decarboxylase family protein YurZ/quercetin dioxygenase-like cupin family protein
MKALMIRSMVMLFVTLGCMPGSIEAKNNNEEKLNNQEQSIVTIAALTAKGDLASLTTALNGGLEAGLTVNEVKEVLVHTYAYCGFPRSIRGLQTFMDVLDKRKTKGIVDKIGKESSPIANDGSKYDRGKKILGELTKASQSGPLTGYSAFAPVIDRFLKEHLFADIFERDVLTYAQRELVTISVLSAVGGVEPMLRGHLSICLNVGLSPQQLTHFITVIEPAAGREKAEAANAVLNEVLQNRAPDKKADNAVVNGNSIFPQGEKITNDNFKGTAYLKMMIEADPVNPTAVGNVTFEPGARTKWHLHPGGQILLVTDGVGYYQEKGQSKKNLQKGDVIKCPPNTPHWHGASANNRFVQVAVTNNHLGATIWLEPVTDEEYNAEAK